MVSGAEGSCHPQPGLPCFHSSKESPQGNRLPFPRDRMKKIKAPQTPAHSILIKNTGAGRAFLMRKPRDRAVESLVGVTQPGGGQAETRSQAPTPLLAPRYHSLLRVTASFPEETQGVTRGALAGRLRGRGTQSREPRSGVKASRPLGVLTGSDFCFKSAAAMGCGLGAGRSSIRGLGLSSGQSARWQRGQKREKAPASAIPREEPGPDASSFVPHHSQGPELCYKTGHSTGQTLQPGPSPTLLC